MHCIQKIQVTTFCRSRSPELTTRNLVVCYEQVQKSERGLSLCKSYPIIIFLIEPGGAYVTVYFPVAFLMKIVSPFV